MSFLSGIMLTHTERFQTMKLLKYACTDVHSPAVHQGMMFSSTFLELTPLDVLEDVRWYLGLPTLFSSSVLHFYVKNNSK